MNHTNESPQDPAVKLAPKEPGAPAADDHDLSGPPSPETIARGYEIDVYDAKTVLSVPLMVIGFFVAAFGTVTVLFSIYSKPDVNPLAHPGAADRNKADLNTRMNRIHRGGEIDQPRLEPLVLRSGDARAITRPPLPTGNSPELHAEDLIVTKDRFPALYKTDTDHLGIDKAMSLTDDALKTLFKTQAGATTPLASEHTATAANAGRPAPPKLPEVKQPDPKPKTPEPTPMPKGEKK